MDGRGGSRDHLKRTHSISHPFSIVIFQNWLIENLLPTIYLNCTTFRDVNEVTNCTMQVFANCFHQHDIFDGRFYISMKPSSSQLYGESENR